jgi:hypothetical protein
MVAVLLCGHAPSPVAELRLHQFGEQAALHAVIVSLIGDDINAGSPLGIGNRHQLEVP